MCGIVGYVGPKDVSSVLLVGLTKLEYRGYDSAGIAVLVDGELVACKKAGKLRALSEYLDKEPIEGNIGIGHTRWATHGEPTETNAHPHLDCKGKVAVVHNGIIENFYAIREKLISEGHVFKSETDTEVIPHLIEKYFKGDLKEAVQKATEKLEGSYAFAVITAEEPDKIVCARKGSPLLIGLGDGENTLASDIPALLSHTRDILPMEDGEIAVVSRQQVDLFSSTGEPVPRRPMHVEWKAEMVDKGGYPHFMLKEIHEQPQVVEAVLKRRVGGNKGVNFFTQLGITNGDMAKVRRIVIQACGTSWHAGLIGKYLLESYCRVHTEVDISSEFRYRNPVIEGETLVMAISQSGETADTLAGLREAKAKFLKVLSVVNVMGSSIARESDGVIYIHAGPEIGVASTKAYTAEILALYLFTIYLARIKWLITDQQAAEMLDELDAIPEKMRKILSLEDTVRECAQKYYSARDFLFLGRGFNYPSALEGALKLKEIAYIHATGHPAGEMKHGPIALVDEAMPVVCIVPKSLVYEKMMSNVEEVKARGGKVIAIATEGDKAISTRANDVLYIPEVNEELSPMLVALPLQLLAYHIAILRGCDVDKPRNLAKSVTVE